MLLTDVYYQAGEIEARALRDASWARLTAPIPVRHSQGSGARRAIGSAFIRIGELISSEPAIARHRSA